VRRAYWPSQSGAANPRPLPDLVLRTLFFFGVLAAAGATVFGLLTRGMLGDRIRAPLAHLLFFALLAAFLGWYYLEQGRVGDACAQLSWVVAQAAPNGDLPEQVTGHLLAPESYEEWVERWGPIATPLLWSHAMFVTLAVELGLAEPDA